MRILVIDDEAAVATMLAEALEAEGHEPAVALDGPSGLARVAADPPDAVFLDLAMPGMHGLDVLRELRRRDPALPVVVISGRADDAELEEARRIGVSDVIDKPLILNELTRAIGTLDPP